VVLPGASFSWATANVVHPIKAAIAVVINNLFLIGVSCRPLYFGLPIFCVPHVAAADPLCATATTQPYGAGSNARQNFA
jgi:hypothetical protein